MEYILIIALVLIVSAALTVRRCVIFEHQRGLLYSRGKFAAVLPPGDRLYFRPFHTITKVDVRTVNVTIPGQEVLSSDNIGLKMSLAASYRLADPYLALSQVVNYQETLYLLLQLNLREIISSLAVDDLLAQREAIGQQLYEKSTSQAAGIGLELLFVNIKDIMFPGELKNIFAQVVNARKEGLAALERARGESAALRSLANAASVFDNNPNLLQLRLFQVLEKSSGNTVVMLPPENNVTSKLLDKAVGKSGEKERRLKNKST
ncbi:Protein QmcA [Thermoflexales bacterium]|nr:Protein QmcA [Thermoflexales bacterium]